LLRVAPSGHLVGIDMYTAIELAAARNCDIAVLSKSLPAAEVGQVEVRVVIVLGMAGPD
jgi:hypothetical protein